MVGPTVLVSRPMNLEVGKFDGYELVDSGGGRKLERFGGVLLDRPSPQALWPRDEGAPWTEIRASFHRGEGGNGEWKSCGSRLPDSWTAEVGGLTFEIRLTGFGNVGLFPEHACHWQWIADVLGGRANAEVLNLFAYTGGASLAAARAGARVTHLDAAKAVNGWARANATANGSPEDRVRYLADDALKFARREGRRERKYDGVIIDPPSFGRGPKGEVWKLERDLTPLCEACLGLLTDTPAFVLLTSHSPGVTPRVLAGVLHRFGGTLQAGEMLLTGGGPPLPAGAYVRWRP